MAEQALRDLFNFDDSDLFANRNGKLSQKQQKKMMEHDIKISRDIIIIGLVFLCIASIPLLFFSSSISLAWQNHNFTGTSLLFPTIWGLIWAGSGIYFIYNGFFNKSIPQINIRSVSGSVNLVRVKRTGTSAYSVSLLQLHVGQEVFNIDDKLGAYIKQGDIYSIYFYNVNSSVIKKILSLEKLPQIIAA